MTTKILADSLGTCNCVSSSNKIKLEKEFLVVAALSNNAYMPGQFIVMRRGCQLSRVIDVWKRAAKKGSVMVSFCGEQGVDSGGMAMEFSTLVLPCIGSAIFPRGIPVESTIYVQNSSFLNCGQIFA